jgi:hypothetical protein
VTADSVEIFSNDENVKTLDLLTMRAEIRRQTYLDERVVQDKHNGGDPPSPLSTKQHLTNVTGIPNFRMAKTEFPDDERRVQDDCRHGDRQDQSWDETKSCI